MAARETGGQRGEARPAEGAAARTARTLQGRVEVGVAAQKGGSRPGRGDGGQTDGAKQLVRHVFRSANDALQPFSGQLKSAEAASKNAAKATEKFARDTRIADAAEFVQNPREKTGRILKSGVDAKTREMVRQVLGRANGVLEPYSSALKKTEVETGKAARATGRFAERSGLAGLARTVQQGDRTASEVKNVERGVKDVGRAFKNPSQWKSFTREAVRIEKKLPRENSLERAVEQPRRRLEGAEREQAEARLQAVRKRLEHVETRMLGDKNSDKAFLRDGISRDRQPERHAKVEKLWNKLKQQEHGLVRDLNIDRHEDRLAVLKEKMKQGGTEKQMNGLKTRIEATERKIDRLNSKWTYRKDVRGDWKFEKSTGRDGKETVTATGKLWKQSETINWRSDSVVGGKLDAAARNGVGRNGDHAGHLAAVSLGADPRESINLTSQNARMNVGQGWRDIERAVTARANQEPGGSLRAEFKSVRADGRETHRTFAVRNQDGETVPVHVRNEKVEDMVDQGKYIAGNFRSPSKEIPPNLPSKDNVSAMRRKTE